MKKSILLILLSLLFFACNSTRSTQQTEKENNLEEEISFTEEDSTLKAISELPPYNTNSSVHTIAFYNVENLFDIEDDPNTYDEDFTPTGRNKWTKERYEEKIKKIAKVISMIGDEDGAEIIGLAEIESEKVLQDLSEDSQLKKYGYKYVHYDSPDERGIDVALLYKEANFKVTSSKNYHIELPKNDKTRDILLVKGNLEEQPIHILVNHWSSRGGGEAKSAPKRMIAAQVARQIVDDIEKQNSKAKILLMGDFNDEPSNKSLTEGLKARDKPDIKGKELFNIFATLEQQGKGTYNYKGNWNMLDQIIINKGFFRNDDSPNSWYYLDGNIYDEEFLKEAKGKYKGNPFRMYVGPRYLGGYSDHFPIYIHLKR